MDKFVTLTKLMCCFPESFLNNRCEFIAHRESNSYFNFAKCNSEEDVKFKVLSWFSRDTFKTEPFDSEICNKNFHRFMLKGVNSFLGTKFTESNMKEIYTWFGNECNEKQCREFIKHGYDMKYCKKWEGNND